MTGPLLWQLVQRWEEGRSQGREPTAAEVCHDCPEFAAEVERLLPLLRSLRLWPTDDGEQADRSRTVATIVFKPPTVPAGARDLGNADAPAPAGYQILEEVGRGGMGVVYKARQMRLDRVVALKMILAQGHASLPERLRFLDEARAVAAIQHPGVVTIYEVGEHNGLPFFALEYCSGGSLADRLRGTPLAPREAAELVERLARAVQAAHKQGIVHRDLKPGNVLLASGGREPPESAPSGDSRPPLAAYAPKVTDFGLAKKLEVAGITRPGELMGTPSYMAPEQAGMEAVGPAADIYALGAILYECLTGRPPFKGATMLETLEQVRGSEPVSVRALAPSTARDLETICLKCLRKEPAQRYGSAVELAEDLRRWQDGEPIVARPVGPIERAVKAVRRRPLVWGLLAAVVLAMTTGTVVSLLFAREARRQTEVARENEADAREKEQNLREAREQILQTLAAGLLRPLGHTPGVSRLNDFELKALGDLAALPREWDSVRVLLIEQALQHPTTAGQLERRMEPLLTAALGLDARKRREVLEVLARRLADPGLPPDTRRACARLAVALDADEPGLAADAAAALRDAAARESDPDALRMLAADFRRLSPRLDAATARSGAAAVAGRLLAAIKESAEYKDSADQESLKHEDLKALAESYLGLEPRLDPGKAREGSAAAAHWLLVAIPRAREVVTLKALADLAGRLSRSFAPADADRVSAQVLDFMTTRTVNPEVLEALADLVVRVAEKQDPERGKKAVAAVKSRLRTLLGKAEEGLAVKTLARALARAGCSEAEAEAAAARVLDELTKAEDAFAREALAEAYAALAPRQSRQAAEAGSARALGHVLDAVAQGADEFTLEPLARAAARLAPLAGAAESRAAAERVAGLMAASGDPAALEPLALAFAALAARLDAKSAHALAAPAATRVLELMSAESGDSLMRLRRGFGHLAGSLDRATARAARAKAASHLREEMARTEDPVALAELLDAVGALEGAGRERRPSPRAEAALARLVETASRDPDSAARLTRAFAILAPACDERAAREGAAALVHRILDRRQGLDDEHAALLAHLTAAQLVNLLKHPCCTGGTRRHVLDYLGERLQVRLGSVWDLSRQDRVSLGGLDLLAPAELPGVTPPAPLPR